MTWLVLTCLGLSAAAGSAAAEPAKTPAPVADTWPLWEAFQAHFINPDGRVVDHTGGDKTTSEGQAYGLFFALVANDREAFDTILDWTLANLGVGARGGRLPSWVWGKDNHGRWRVLDTNAASDADLWMAYALLEAGRLWSSERYTKIANGLLNQIAAREVVSLPGVGPMVLPGPHGFVLEADQRWRLNPSYVPIQLLRRFAEVDPAGPWNDIVESTVRMLTASAPHGFAPDWVEYRRTGGFVPDEKKGPIGSYDAIRIYLWTETLASSDPARTLVATSLSGMYLTWAERGRLPERINTQSPDSRSGRAPVGYFGALLPQALNWGGEETAHRVERQIEAFRTGELYGDPPHYFDHCLLLFGTGFREGRYHFDETGHLHPRWDEK